MSLLQLRGVLICHTVPFVGSLPPPGGLDRLRALSLPSLVFFVVFVSCLAFRPELGGLGSQWG